MTRIPMFAVHISEAAIQRAASTLRSGYVGDGPVVREFESKVKRYLGAPCAIAVSSGTSALRLALAVTGVGPGDEVITSAQTFAATSHVILDAGARPVYADVQYLTGNLDPSDVERRMTPRTKAILPVHWAGYPCDMDELLAVGRRHGVGVIEDAAQAFGAIYRGRRIGALPSIACFSFQAVKQLTTVDGGMLCCQDETLGDAARRRRWFGIDRERRVPALLGEPHWDISEVGYKFHMNDVTASLGTEHIDEYETVRLRLADVAGRYRSAFESVSGVTQFASWDDRESAHWVYCLHVERRDDFARAVQSRGVDTSVVHLRIDRHTVFGPERSDLPQLARLTETMICLPLHYALSDDDVDAVIAAVRTGW